MAERDGAAGFRQTVEKRLTKSGALLTRMGVTPAEYARVVLNALTVSSHNAKPGRPSLADCTPESLDLALIKCINAGLLPDGEEAVIVPLKSGQGKDAVVKAEVWPGFPGMLKQYREAVKGARFVCRTVYRDDKFRHVEGADMVLEHQPNENADQSAGQVRAVYAIAWPPGADAPEWEVMYRSEIDRRRARAPGAGKGGPWATDYAEMAEKTVGKLLLKRCPRRANALRDPSEGASEAETVEVRAIEHAPADPMDEVLGETKEREPVTVEAQAPAKERKVPPAPKAAEEPAPFDPDDSPFG